MQHSPGALATLLACVQPRALLAASALLPDDPALEQRKTGHLEMPHGPFLLSFSLRLVRSFFAFVDHLLGKQVGHKI